MSTRTKPRRMTETECQIAGECLAHMRRALRNAGDARKDADREWFLSEIRTLASLVRAAREGLTDQGES